MPWDSRGHPEKQGTRRTTAPEGETTKAQPQPWARSSKEGSSFPAARCPEEEDGLPRVWSLGRPWPRGPATSTSHSC